MWKANAASFSWRARFNGVSQVSAELRTVLVAMHLNSVLSSRIDEFVVAIG